MEKRTNIVSLDEEWVRLILKAKGLGLKTEEVRFFLKKEQKET